MSNKPKYRREKHIHCWRSNDGEEVYCKHCGITKEEYDMATDGPIRGNEHLHEEIEVEEVYSEQDDYNQRRALCEDNIMSALEDLMCKKKESWGRDEELLLIDIMSSIDNNIKAHLSANIKDYMM